jgi:hypothetical protein
LSVWRAISDRVRAGNEVRNEQSLAEIAVQLDKLSGQVRRAMLSCKLQIAIATARFLKRPS